MLLAAVTRISIKPDSTPPHIHAVGRARAAA
jgi:hypothetical protein